MKCIAKFIDKLLVFFGLKKNRSIGGGGIQNPKASIGGGGIKNPKKK